MDSNQRFSTAQKGRESARQSREAAQLRNPAPYSREGIRKRLEDGSEYDDVLITEDYTKLKDFALESGFISKEEAGKIASHKADRVAALIAEGKGKQFAGREFRPDMSPEAALAKRQDIGAGYAAQAPVERQKDIELLAKLGYTPEDVAKFGTDRSGFIPEGVPIFGGNEVPILSKSFWKDPARNIGISAYQGGVGLGAAAEGIVAPARALATHFTGGDPTQFYAPNDNPLVEAGTIFGSNAAESVAGFPARYAGMRIGGELGFRGALALSGGNPLWGGVGAVAGGMLGQLGMGKAMETLNDAAMNLILGRENAARLQQRKQEMSAAYPLASRIGEELPDLAMFGPSFKVKGFSGKAAAKGFKQAGMKGLRQGVVDTTEFAGDLAERGGESALNMVLAYKQSEDEKKLGMPGKSAWDILAEGALGAVMQGDTKLGRAVYGGMNKLTDPRMIQQAINRTAPSAMPEVGARPMSPAVDTGSAMRPGMRRFNLGGRIESGVDADGSPIIKGARYAVYDPETRKAQVYTDNEFALEGTRTRKAAQSLQGTSTIFKRQPIISYDDKVVGGQRQILGITRDAGVLVRDYTNDGKSTISAVPLSEIRNAKINKRINEVIENLGVKPNSRPAPFMPESFTNFNPVAFPDTVTLTTDSQPIPARVVERIGGKTDASYIVAMPDGTHFRAHESQINVDKFTGGEHITRGAMKDTDFPRSLADLAPKRGGLEGLVRIGEGSDAPSVELTPTQRKDYQSIATKYQPDINAIKREPDATRRGQMLDIVQGKIANEYLATNPIPAPAGTYKEGDVVDVNLSQKKFAGKPQTAIVTDVNDYGYAVRLVDHPNVGTFTVQDANVMGESKLDIRATGSNKGVESLAAGRISAGGSTATRGVGVPAVTRGYASGGMAATDVATVSDVAKHVDYVSLPEDVQQSIQKRFKKAVDDGEVTSGNSIDFVAPIKDGQVHGQIHVHALDNMTFQIVATTFPEGGGAIKDQYVSSYNVRYNPDTDMWDVYSVDPEMARRISESDEAAYMAISHLKNVAPVDDVTKWDRVGTPKDIQRHILNTYLDAVNVKFPIDPKLKSSQDFDTLKDSNEFEIHNAKYIAPFNIDSYDPSRYYRDVWTNDPLDMNDPAQFARASDAGRNIYMSLNEGGSYGRVSAEQTINNQRLQAMTNLVREVNSDSNALDNTTEIERQLFFMMASKYNVDVKFDSNNNVNIKLGEISKNNETLPITFAQADILTFISLLRSKQTPKQAFFAAISDAYNNAISNRSVPQNGWKKYDNGPLQAQELMKDVQGTIWCIASSEFHAKNYLQMGPFYVYFENFQPKIAYGGNSSSVTEAPRGNRNGQTVTADEQKIATVHMQKNGVSDTYQVDLDANKSAVNIIDGIGTEEDFVNVNKLRSESGYQGSSKKAALMYRKLTNGNVVELSALRFANRYSNYGNARTQLEYLTKLPKFEKNYVELADKLSEKTSAGTFKIEDIDTIHIGDIDDYDSLQMIYENFIKDQGKQLNIKVTVVPDMRNNHDLRSAVSNINQSIYQTDIDNIFNHRQPNTTFLASHFDNDLSWAVFDVFDAPAIFMTGNDGQTLKMNAGSSFMLMNDVSNNIVEIQQATIPAQNGKLVIVDIVNKGQNKTTINKIGTTEASVALNPSGGVHEVNNLVLAEFNPRLAATTLTDSVGSSTYLAAKPGSASQTVIINTTNDIVFVNQIRNDPDDHHPSSFHFLSFSNPAPLYAAEYHGYLDLLHNAHVYNYTAPFGKTVINNSIGDVTCKFMEVELDVQDSGNIEKLTLQARRGKTTFTSNKNGQHLHIERAFTSELDDVRQTDSVTLNLTGRSNTVEITTRQQSLLSREFKINSPNAVDFVQRLQIAPSDNVSIHSRLDDGKFKIVGNTQTYQPDGGLRNSFDDAIYKSYRGESVEISQHELSVLEMIRQAVVATHPEAQFKKGSIETNLNKYDLSNIDMFDWEPELVRVALLAKVTKVYDDSIFHIGNRLEAWNRNTPTGTLPLIANGQSTSSDQSDVVTPPEFKLDPDIYTIEDLKPPTQLNLPDSGDEAAYQEVDDAGVTSSKTPKKVSAGYKLQGSFRVSVPTSQLRRYREEVNKLAIQHGVDSDAYKRAMKKLDAQYRDLISQASTQVLAIINKIATEQRPNVTGYQQKDTTAARIGYAIKSIDRNFNNLPKPSGDTPDNRLGTYKMMFNALGEDYSVDAFRVSNRAQLKTVLQKQYEYDATNAGRVAEVVDRFARAWAMGKIQAQGFRPTEIVEVTGKLAENILETGAYNTPSSDMLFQHFPGGSKAETKLVAQYMREFYEERFAAFGVLDDAYDFTKKFRGAIFRTNKSKDDAILNVIVGFASRDETTGIHEIAHALFRGMGYPFQRAIAEAMNVNPATLNSTAMKGRVPIWVEEKWAAAFEGSLRAGVAPQARDVNDSTRPRQQDPTLAQLWMELGGFLTGARNATIKKQIASGVIPEWGKDEKGTRWVARFKAADKLYRGNELELNNGQFVTVNATQAAAGEPVQVVDVDSGKVSTVVVDDIKRYSGRVPSGFNDATLDTLSNWLRSYYGNTERNIRTTLPDMVADYVGGEVDLGQLRAEATNPQKIAFQETMDEPRSPLLSSLSRMSSVQAGLKSLLANNRLEIGNKGTVKNAYDRYGKPSNSFRVLRDVYGFDGNTAAAYYAQTETPEFKKWSENLPLLEAVNSIQVSPDIDMNKMSPVERVNYRRYEAGNELANLASDIMRDGADDNDVDKFVDLADQYYRNDGRSQKEIRNAVEQIVNANEDDNVQQLMSFESTLRRELETSEDFDQARKVTVTPDEYRIAAHTPRTGKGFVTVSFPAMESSNLIRSKNGVVLTSGVTSFDGNRQGGEYIKFKNPQVVNLEGQGIDQQKLDRIIANATKAKRDGVVILNLRHSNTVNSALHNVAVPITKYPTKSIVAVPGVDIGTYFSGGGTLEASVYKSVFPTVAVEYNAEIASVYRANLGDHVQVKDVQEIDPTSLKNVQWFHASPVCKNFSDASPNAVETILDKKTGKAVVDAIDHSHPPIVTIENVAKYRESESFDAILEALRRNGYEFDFGVYKTSEYGGGTSRQRLIVRAVRGFALPPIIKTDASQRTWYESIKDIIDTLPISELAPNQLRKLEASKIDVRAMKTPVLFSQNSYHAVGITADKVFPSFTTSGGTYRILMPGGQVRAITGIAFRRMMGLPDAYLLPESEPLARKILANGVPAELSQTIMAPLADAYARHNMTRMAQREMRRRDTDDEAAYQEMDDEPRKSYGSFTDFVVGINTALRNNNLPEVTDRTIRFWISKNQVNNGVKSGRAMTYSQTNVNEVVQLVKDKQAEETRNVVNVNGKLTYPSNLYEQPTFTSIEEFTVAVNQFLEIAGAQPINERLIRYYVAEGLLPRTTERQGQAKVWTQEHLERTAELAVQSQDYKYRTEQSKLQRAQQELQANTEQPVQPEPVRPENARPMSYEDIVYKANVELRKLGLEYVTKRILMLWGEKGKISRPNVISQKAVFNPNIIDEIIKVRKPNPIKGYTGDQLILKANEQLIKLGLPVATDRALRFWLSSGSIAKPEKVGKSYLFGDDDIEAIVKIRRSQARDTGDEAAYQEADDLFPSQRRTVETYDMPGAPSHVERIRPKQLPPRNAWFWGAIDLYNDITRLPLSGDLAFQNLQGGIIGLSNPLVGLKAFKAGLKGFAPNMQVEVGGQLYGSRKFGRETYHAAGEEMRRHPLYNAAKEAGLPLAMFEIDARLQEAREIELSNLKMSNPNATMKDVNIGLMDIDELGTVDEWYSKNRITRHLPMQGQFERFNSLVHDTLLLTQFDNWAKILLSKGYSPTSTMYKNALKDSARILAVSVGDIKYSTNPETDAAASRIAKIFFTAPRWLMSRALIDPFINQIVSNSSIFARLREIMGEDNPAFNLYNGDKEVAKLGQSMWLRIAAAEAMLAIMAWVFSNWYPDTEVNTDIQPGRIRIGDFQIDPVAGLIDHYKLAGRIAKAVFSVDPRDASRAEKEGIPQWMLAVKDISKELSYKASPGITFLMAISGSNDLKAQSDNFFTAPWEAKSLNVVGEPLFERSASAKIFYEMIRPRLREVFGDAVADDLPISNMMMDRIPMALPGFVESFAAAKEYDRDPWVYAMADTIPNFFGFKVDVMPTEARKDRAKNKNMSTAQESPTLLRLLAEGRASEAFTGTMKSSPPSGNVSPW